MTSKIDVLLVDDHAVVRTGYKTYLSLSDNIRTISEADRGEIACQLYQSYKPDIVILDLSMPGISGFECIRRLVNRDPNCNILVFSIYRELVYVSRALKAGAKGYISKNSNPEMLIFAVCQVAKGNSYIEPTLAQELAINISLNEDKINLVTDSRPANLMFSACWLTG